MLVTSQSKRSVDEGFRQHQGMQLTLHDTLGPNMRWIQAAYYVVYSSFPRWKWTTAEVQFLESSIQLLLFNCSKNKVQRSYRRYLMACRDFKMNLRLRHTTPAKSMIPTLSCLLFSNSSVKCMETLISSVNMGTNLFWYGRQHGKCILRIRDKQLKIQFSFAEGCPACLAHSWPSMTKLMKPGLQGWRR